MTEHKHSAEHDCNTCRHHVQGCSLDDVPARCWDCTGYGAIHTPSYLPQWQPIEIKKENPMSGGMEEAARLEAEEAERDMRRFAVAPRRLGEFTAEVAKSIPLSQHFNIKYDPLAKVGDEMHPQVDPLKTQVGGTHYKGLKIQPLEFAIANKLDFCQHNIVKYTVRRKGDKVKRIEDLNKAKHLIDVYIQALEKGDMV